MPADALTRIRARGHIGIRLGLDRMRALLSELADPQLALRGVLVAGTNGKGSVAAMVAAMLQAAGFSTARSPSPHLSSYRERVMIDGSPISEADLDGLLEEVLQASQPGEARHGPATEFELLTAAAFLWSARLDIDVMVMEVGLGGRLDASNAWSPDVAAISNVGLDHEEYLGHSLAAIAAEKAAIIKPGSRAVTGASGVALEVIEARARDVGAPLTVCRPLVVERMDRSRMRLQAPGLGGINLSLLGRHQAHNAAVALGIASALGDAGVADVPGNARRAGLEQARWPGRMELIDRDGVTVLLDGAHNPDGAAALAATIDELAHALPKVRATLLLGIMADKAVDAMLHALTRSTLLRGSRVVTTDVPDSDRSMAASELAKAWHAASGQDVAAVVDDCHHALEHALELAAEDGGLLVITGSLYLVGGLRPWLLPIVEAA